MASLVGALRVTLGLNSAQYEAGMRRAGRTARTSGNEITRALATAQRTAVNAFRGIAAAAGGMALGAAVGGIARYIDAAKNLESQLRLATRESGTFAQAQEDVRRIAQASRSDLDAVANLYSTFQRNAHELNITQAQTARLTETVTKSFLISGATAAEATGGLRQFLQGLQSNTLRGEELNSVLENAPRLARALADGLGVTIGELRRMGTEGELTGQRVTQAILDASSVIDQEFSGMAVTFDQAMTQIRNAAVVAAGGFDDGGEFSNALINFAGTGRMSFEEIEEAAYETGRQIRAIFDGLGNVFDPMGEGAVNVFEFIKQEAIRLRLAIADILGGLDLIFGAIDRAAEGAAAGVGAYGEAAQIRYNRQNRNTLRENFLQGGGILGPAMDLTRRTAGRAFDMIPGQSDRPAMPPRPSGSGSGGRRRTGGGRGGADRAQREADAQVRRRFQVESELSRARIAELHAQRDLADTVEERSLLADQISYLEQGQEEAERTLSVLLRDRTQAEADALAEIDTRRFRLERDRIAEDERRELFDQRLELEDQMFNFQADELQSQAGLAETAGERRRLELQLLELTHRHEAAKLDAILAEEAAGSHAWNRARAERDALDNRMSTARSGVMAGTRGPLESFLASLPTTAAKANEALQAVAAEGLQSLEDGIVGLIDGTKSLGEAFSDMAKSIIADLIRIQIQQSIIGPLAGALGGIFGGGGGKSGGGNIFGSLAGSMLPFGGGKATGGPVIAGRAYLVGEKGPELIAMGGNGHVVPNSSIGGGPREINVTVSGARGNQEIREMVMQGVGAGLAQYDGGVASRVSSNFKRRA